MRVLVIGGTRFVGKCAVELLLRRGHELILLHKGTTNPFGARVQSIRVDRANHMAVKSALKAITVDVIIDSAYSWELGTSADDIRAIVTAIGSRVARYVFISSAAVYEHRVGLIETDSLSTSVEPYVHNKIKSERYLLDCHRSSGLPIIILRPPFVLGPGNNFYREEFFWDRMSVGRQILVPDQGTTVLQFVDVYDFARAICAAIDSSKCDGEAFYIATSPPLTHTEFVSALARAAGTTASIAPVPRALIAAHAQPGTLYFGEDLDVPSFSLDIHKSKDRLGYVPSAWESTLAHTYTKYLQASKRRVLEFGFEETLIRAAGGETVR
jgi:nucleoside-diphosphate-sugar epimerase